MVDEDKVYTWEFTTHHPSRWMTLLMNGTGSVALGWHFMGFSCKRRLIADVGDVYDFSINWSKERKLMCMRTFPKQSTYHIPLHEPMLWSVFFALCGLWLSRVPKHIKQM